MLSVRGDRIKPGELTSKLASLDIDEGIRVERGGKKVFVNKNPSGAFVVQLGNSLDFRYFDSAWQVTKFIQAELGRQATAWMY